MAYARGARRKDAIGSLNECMLPQFSLLRRSVPRGLVPPATANFPALRSYISDVERSVFNSICTGTHLGVRGLAPNFSPKPGDTDIGTGAEAGAADVVSPVADELQDP